MPKSKLENWFQIAETGLFPQGDLTEDLFDELVKTFNPAHHEPPVTLGHITESHNDKPAMAWISAVKRVGNKLMAKASEVWDEFDEMVRTGRFKKRSIAIWNREDGLPYLHHLAFLGATPPAVKGLPDLYHAQGKSLYHGQGNADGKVYEFKMEHNSNPKQDGKDMPKEYTEAQIQELKDQAAAEAKKGLYSEDDLEKAKQESAEAAKEQAAKEYKEQQEAQKKITQHRSKVDEFCEKGVKEGFITPAMLNKGLKALMYSMDPNAEITYSEKDGNDTKETKVGTFAALQAILQQYKAAPAGQLPDTTEPGKDGNYAAEKALAEKKYKEAQEAGLAKTYGECVVEARDELNNKAK